MMPQTATAGLLSAAVLLAPSCSRAGEQAEPEAHDPLRRAAYRVLVARDLLLSCGAAAGEADVRRELARLDQLRSFALAKDAGQALWLAENDRNAVRIASTPQSCASGTAAYRDALAGFSASLDRLAAEIVAFPEGAS